MHHHTSPCASFFSFSHLVAELLLLRLLQLPHEIITESKFSHAVTIHLLSLVFWIVLGENLIFIE